MAGLWGSLAAVVVLIVVVLIYRKAGRNRPAGTSSAGVPEWASFFTPGQFRQFIATVENGLRQQGRPFRMGDGVVETTDEHGEPLNLGLHNAAQICHQEDTSVWPQIIASLLSTRERARQESEDFVRSRSDFSKVRHMLGVRLWPGDTFKSPEARVAQREDIPGVSSALAFDLPSTIKTASIDEVEAWGMSLDEVFKHALDNVAQRLAPMEPQDMAVADGINVRVFMAESFFVASHALLLQQHPGCVGTYGSLVAIPHRHALLVYPVENLDIVKVIPVLKGAAQGMFEEGPGSISPEVYWYQNGVFTRIPIRLNGDRLEVESPDNFVAMLNEITKKQAPCDQMDTNQKP